MADPKTDSSGQVVQPIAITHFGDGSTALSNRDVSQDLRALIDDTIKGLMRSLGDAGAAPVTYSGKTTLKLLADILDRSDWGMYQAFAGNDKNVWSQITNTTANTWSHSDTPAYEVAWTPANGKTGYLKQVTVSKDRPDALAANDHIQVALQVDGVWTAFFTIRGDQQDKHISFELPYKLVGNGVKKFRVISKVFLAGSVGNPSIINVTLRGWEE